MKGIVGTGVLIDGKVLLDNWTIITLPLEPSQLDGLAFGPLAGVNTPAFFRYIYIYEWM